MTHTTQCLNCYIQIDIDEIFYHKIEEQKKFCDGVNEDE